MLSIDGLVTDAPFSGGLNCLMISVSVWNEKQFQLREHFNIISALELSLVTQGQSVIKSTCCVDIHVLGVISWKTKGTVYLLFTRENRKFRLENQMVHIISFRRLQKIWVVIWDDAINLFFYPFQSVQLIWIYSVCSGLFTHHFKFNRYIFLHKISTQVVCVNGAP